MTKPKLPKIPGWGGCDFPGQGSILRYKEEPMTSKKTKQAPVVIEQSREPVQARLDKRSRDLARLYGIPCRCWCDCRVKHRFGDVCVLCRDGDHWENLAAYLAKIETREIERDPDTTAAIAEAKAEIEETS